MLDEAQRQDHGLFLLRCSLAAMMLFHGYAKLRGGLDHIMGLLSARGLPEFLAYGAYVGEIVAPIFLIIGLFTRAAAMLIVVNMVFAIFLVHLGDIFSVNARTGAWAIELQMLYVFGALTIFYTGPGLISVSRGRGTFD
jgi:putative oxidoreductase